MHAQPAPHNGTISRPETPRHKSHPLSGSPGTLPVHSGAFPSTFSSLVLLEFIPEGSSGNIRPCTRHCAHSEALSMCAAACMHACPRTKILPLVTSWACAQAEHHLQLQHPGRGRGARQAHRRYPGGRPEGVCFSVLSGLLHDTMVFDICGHHSVVSVLHCDHCMHLCK